MEAIFGKKGATLPPLPTIQRPRARPIVIRPGAADDDRGTGWRLAGAAALATLVAAVITITAQRQDAGQDAAPLPPRQEIAARDVGAPPPQPQPELAPAPVASVEPPAPEPVAVVAASASPPAKKPPARPARAKRKAASKTEQLADASPSQPAPVAVAAAPAQPRCEGMTANREAWCLRPAVLEADKDLRAAYANAINIGVARSTLSSYRKRWAKLRKQSSDEPRHLIGSYRAMTEELALLSTQARAGR
nr:hypothetical protein [Sphingomonas laterariae]